MPEAGMKRREFLCALGGVAATWPLALYAQPAGAPLIGFLSSGGLGGYRNLLISLRNGLSDQGYVEGRNVFVEYRWAEGRFERLPAMAEELARRGAVVIVTTGIASARGARAASATIPMVFL